MKPSKSLDLNAGNVQVTENINTDPTGLPEQDDEILRQLNQMTSDLMQEEKTSNLYLLMPKERVEQIECGSIHSLARTSMNRLFSCGNGSTFALGHGSKESCKNFKLIQFFNGS